MKKLKTTLLVLALSSGSLFAQSTLNATGGQGTIGGNTYEYSIGEMTLVSTQSGSNIVVTQGLLQPSAKFATNTEDLIISQDQLNIYPNPSSAIVNIQPQFKSGGDLQLLLLDASGKVVQKLNKVLSSGTEKQQINISNLANGNYILNVNFGEMKNSYKIQKIN